MQKVYLLTTIGGLGCAILPRRLRLTFLSRDLSARRKACSGLSEGCDPDSTLGPGAR